MTLEFSQLGLAPDFVDYTRGWAIQSELHDNVVADKAPSTVLLLEHAPVYTAGKRTEDHERPFDGTPVVPVDRGGKLTWHGPGQLVGYPIIKLKNRAGIRVHEGVTMHGFAINCNNDLSPYSQIIACGITDAGVTTIAQETGYDVAPADLVSRIIEELRNNEDALVATPEGALL